MQLSFIDQTLEPIDVFFNPDKHSVNISIKKITADRKVYPEGVERYKSMLKLGRDIGTIVVVKHPEKDLYAVLDGHHRFFALKEMKFNKIKCAVIQDPFGILFNLTKDGYIQPIPELTQYLVVPLKRFEEQLNELKKRHFNRLANSYYAI